MDQINQSSDNIDAPEKIEDIQDKPALYDNKKAIFTCLALALYWVIFLWNFWQKDILALGFNTTVCLLGVFVLLYFIYPEKKMLVANNYYWLIPLGLIALSFSLFDNPFIKSITMLVYPVLLLVFFNYSQLSDELKKFWGFRLIGALIARVFSILGNIANAAGSYFGLIKFKDPRTGAITKKIIAGLVLLLVISFTIVLPLLSSADKVFGDYISSFYAWFGQIVSLVFINKIIVFIIWSILLLALAITWTKKFDYQCDEKEKKTDSIISGIVLGGILIFYLLFLFIQLKYLWVKSLPIDFSTTETLVKSGFWQLFVLSVLNIFLFFFTFHKTNAFVQKILAVFTLASFMLLISAGYRMAMYVFYYGFSYEKFYASYTVLFCAVLFIWLLSRFTAKNKTDVVKFIVFLFLWMFALITIFPTEQFIMRANIALSKNKDTRIDLYEMTMLSPDVLGLVKAKKDSDLMQNINCHNNESGDTCKIIDWSGWIIEREDTIKNKKWYEKNFGNF
jgi:hypothetical protein